MPPIARVVALILIGLFPVDLAAQTYEQGRSYQRSNGVESSRLDTAPRFRPETNSASRVVAASYDTPVPDPNVGRSVRGAGDSLPLSPPRKSALSLSPPSTRTSLDDGKSKLKSLLTIGSSLAIVLGLFFVFVWFMRRNAPAGSATLPKEVVEVLGRAPLASRQQIHLLRCGKKLLLVSVTPTGVETLTEITDPVEVDRLAGICRQASAGSISNSFRQVFQQLGREQSETSTFVDDRHVAGPTLRGKLDGTLEDSNV